MRRPPVLARTFAPLAVAGIVLGAAIAAPAAPPGGRALDAGLVDGGLSADAAVRDGGAPSDEASRRGPEAARRRDRPTVYVGVYLHDVTRVALADGTFDVDAEYWAKWRDVPGWRFDPETITVANGGRVTKTKIREESDGDWHAVSFRLRGPLRGEFPLRDFPFDRQRISLEFSLPGENGYLEPDLAASTIEERFSITGWNYETRFVPRVTDRRYPTDLGHIQGEGEAAEAREVAFELPLTRPYGDPALRLFAPLVLLTLLLAASFLVADGAPIVAAIFVATAALATLMAPGLSVTTPLHESTLADRLGALALGLVVVTALAHGLRKVVVGRLPLGRSAPLAAGLVTAIAAFGTALLLRPILARPPVAAPIAPPPVADPPFASRRDVLHFGTTLPLASLTGGIIDAWAFRTLAPAGHAGDDAVYVEEVPSVRTGALELVPGGGAAVRWTLREGATWSDGVPITTADIAFCASLSPGTQRLRLEVRSPRVVVLHYEDRVAEALDPPRILPRHAFLDVLAAKGITGDVPPEKAAEVYAAIEAKRSREPTPGLGPYRIAAFTAGKQAELEANPHWLGQRPAIARVLLRRYATSKELRAAVVAGEVDITTANALRPEDAESLQREQPERVLIRPAARLIELFVDRGHPLFASVEGRRAVSAALHRRRVVERLYPRGGAVAALPVAGLEGSTAEPVYDASILRAFLAAHPEADQPFPVRCEQGAETDCAIVDLLVEDLVAAGAKAKATPTPAVGELRKGAHGGVILQATNAERAAVLAHFDIAVRGGIYDVTIRHNGFDDATAALWERFGRALYPERRDQLRERLFRRHAETLPTIPVVFPNQRIAASPSLRGWGGPADTFGYLTEYYFFE